MIRNFQSNFTAGEWSPLLEGRVDLAKYQNSLYQMENFLVYPHGPATFRPGFRYLATTKDSSKKSRLIPFIFAEDDAFALEFGDYYIRFMKDREQIVVAYSAWVTLTYYNAGQLVTNSGNYYRCLVNHKAGTFATDLGNGYWVATSGELFYEIPSPYAEADVAKIKFCQSADVLYLFHPEYPPYKLMRVDDDDWTIQIINFAPEPLIHSTYYPETTLTPAATTGSSVLFTAGASVFLSGDVGRIIRSGSGKAVINAYYSATGVICNIIDDFATTDAIASGDWRMTGTPTGYLLPSDNPAVGSRLSITVDESDTTATWVNLVIVGENNWGKSSGVDEYYLKNTATCYTGSKPTTIKYQIGDNWPMEWGSSSEGTVGSLALYTWGWGDRDTLGYNTIYVRLGSIDPDSLDANKLQRMSGDTISDCFRASDVGKYITLHGGVLKIVTYTSATEIVCEVVKLMEDDLIYKADVLPDTYTILASWDWIIYEKMWSVTNGYPSCGTFYEDRLFTAGVPRYSENVRGSAVGDYESYPIGIDDDDGLDFTLGGRTVTSIRWLEPRDSLILGTLSSEWRLGPEDTSKAMTPLNVIARQKTSFGCADIDQLSIGNCTLFVQAACRKIRELTLDKTSINTEYVAPDLTMLAEHMTAGKIAGMCYQQEPFSIVWVFLEDGSLRSMTYQRDEEVVAWCRHPFIGSVESIISLPGDGYDEVYIISNKTIDGSTARYIEVLERPFMDDDATFKANKGLNAFFVGCGITYNGSEATTITGLDHLEGEEVAILADGVAKPNQTVTGGQITLTTAASVVHVGLPYTGQITTQRPEFGLKDGTSQGLVKRIISLVIRVLNSGTFKAGRDETNIDEYGFITYDQTTYETLFRNSDTPTGTALTLFTGDKVVPFDGSFNREGRLTIIQDKPLPLTVVGIMADLEVHS